MRGLQCIEADKDEVVVLEREFCTIFGVVPFLRRGLRVVDDVRLFAARGTIG